MSFLSSHVAFAYRLADSQCHNNNEIKRHRSRSLFAFNCNVDTPLDSGLVKNRRKSATDRPGYVNANHREPTRDQDGLVLNSKHMRSESNQADLILKLKERRRMGSGITSETMTGKHAVSIVLTCHFPLSKRLLICFYLPVVLLSPCVLLVSLFPPAILDNELSEG